ncbi:uncharacterized conserved protein [Paenibacillus popilliae ATCC 14706]|uniref:Uncharacterized conserved protein n=2 Tax=Paenibacillus popilliae TaxID=78057 RepID=M9LF92_PAEPP|nr:uncharacterized conserved protein [Paenibacillus popilliae ATCC 14706]
MAGLVAMVACISVSTLVFANSSSKSAPGYGTLYGSLAGTSYTTTVSQNRDNAYLSVNGSIQDYHGNTLVAQQEIRSSRGATSLAGSWNGLPAKAYAIYGGHGVQGGSKYNAYAVYTYTHV